jgi:hypothetical protein
MQTPAQGQKHLPVSQVGRNTRDIKGCGESPEFFTNFK